MITDSRTDPLEGTVWLSAFSGWIFHSVYVISVKNLPAGLIFYAFSCKLRGSYAFGLHAGKNRQETRTQGTDSFKYNGA